MKVKVKAALSRVEVVMATVFLQFSVCVDLDAHALTVGIAAICCAVRWVPSIKVMAKWGRSVLTYLRKKDLEQSRFCLEVFRTLLAVWTFFSTFFSDNE